MIMTENYTQSDGSTEYKLRGPSVEILKLLFEKMNLKTIFLPPSLNMEFDSFVKESAELEVDLSDVLTDTVPLTPLVVTSSFDATIPYLHVNVKMLVPCPKLIPGTEKALTAFSLSVWLTTGLVLLLTTGVFWCAGNVPCRSVCNETNTYQSQSNCFHNAWTDFVAVSVPQQPSTSRFRVFSFCLSLFVSLLALYSERSLFLIWWN
jgi:hypothetical protein